MTHIRMYVASYTCTQSGNCFPLMSGLHNVIVGHPNLLSASLFCSPDFDVAPPSRRALALASPFLPPGAGRKRPIEESPLPLVPSDSEGTPAGEPYTLE